MTYDSVITNKGNTDLNKYDTDWNKHNAYGYGTSVLKDGLRINGMATMAKIEAGDGYYISDTTIRSIIAKAATWLTSEGYGSVVAALNDDNSTIASNNYNALYGIFNNENTWTQGTQVFSGKD